MLKTFIRDRKGNIYLNDSIRYQRTVFLTPALNQYPIVTPAAPAAGARSISPPVIIEGPADSVNKVYRLLARHGDADAADVTNRLTCDITDTIYRRKLSNRDVLVDHVFGQRLIPPTVAVTQLAPFKMCESLFLEPQQTLQLALFNNSTAGSSSLKLQFEAKQTQSPAWNRDDVREEIARDRARKPLLYPFWITPDAGPINLTAGQSRDVFMTVTRDIRLVLFARMASTVVGGGAAGDLVNFFSVQLFDGQTERPLQNQPVVSTCWGGNANNPRWLPTGWVLEPNSLVRIRVTSLLTAGTQDVFLTFAGTASFVG
jgi:hypothetical protein